MDPHKTANLIKVLADVLADTARPGDDSPVPTQTRNDAEDRLRQALATMATDSQSRDAALSERIAALARRVDVLESGFRAFGLKRMSPPTESSDG
jgi:hypothetical protein